MQNTMVASFAESEPLVRVQHALTRQPHRGVSVRARLESREVKCRARVLTTGLLETK